MREQRNDTDEIAEALRRMSAGGEHAPEPPAAADETIDDESDAGQSGHRVSPTGSSAPLAASGDASGDASNAPPPAPRRTRAAAPVVRPATPNVMPSPRVRETAASQAGSRLPTGATSTKTAPASASPPLYRRIEFRRTLIPILLTLGAMLPVLGALPFIVRADSPLAAAQNREVTITFVSVGLVLLLLAVVNMVQVRHELLSSRRGGGGGDPGQARDGKSPNQDV